MNKPNLVCRRIYAVALAAAVASWAFADAQTTGRIAQRAHADLAAPAETVAFPLQASDYESVRGLSQLSLSNVALAPGVFVDLDLTPIRDFGRSARVVMMTDAGEIPLPLPAMAMFRGRVVGDDASRAFVSVSPFGVNGLVLTPERAFTISSGPGGETHRTLSFDLADLPECALRWGEFSCGDGAGELLSPNYSDLPGAAAALGGPRDEPPCRRAQIAIDTDYEYLGLFGGNTTNATAYAYALLGAISEIYERDVNTRLDIVYLRLWSTSADPWNQTNTTDQLFQFQDYWNASMTGVERNAAHFLSGRALGGGVAYLPGLCNFSYDYGLSANLSGYFPYPLQNNHSQNWDVMVVAHELGHNFGARHTHSLSPPADGCGLGDCTNANQGTIMSYCHTCSGGMTNIVLAFHQRNIDEDMLPYLSGVGCDLSRPQFGDLDGDSDVDSQDLALLLAAFGVTAGGDLDENDVTDAQDLALLLAEFGNSACE